MRGLTRSKRKAPLAVMSTARRTSQRAKNAPPIGGQNDWYVFSTLKKFKAGIRGDDPRNTNAVMMRGMSNTLPDDQAMRDVAGYVTSLGR